MKIKLSDGFITEINKTMAPADADGEFIGVAKISKVLIPELSSISDKILCEGRYQSFFEEALQEIIDSECFKIRTIKTNNLPWNEIDFEMDYLEAIRLFS